MGEIQYETASLGAVHGSDLASDDCRAVYCYKVVYGLCRDARAFDVLKTLGDSWEGTATTTPAEPGKSGARIVLSMQIASSGHTLVHEGHAAEYDPMKNPGQKDNPFTMIVIDGDLLELTHYCDADNRPRMIGKLLPDGKTIDFESLDVSGNPQYGHMQHVKFTVVDSDHHT